MNREHDSRVAEAMKRDFAQVSDVQLSSFRDDGLNCIDLYVLRKDGTKFGFAARVLNQSTYHRYKDAEHELSITLDNGLGEKLAEAHKLLTTNNPPDYFIQYLEDKNGVLREPLIVCAAPVISSGKKREWFGRIKEAINDEGKNKKFQMVNLNMLALTEKISLDELIYKTNLTNFSGTANLDNNITNGENIADSERT